MKQNSLERLETLFADKSLRVLVTGGAGFIGSHLVEALLNLNQEVVVLDNFSTGSRKNLLDACESADRASLAGMKTKFQLIEGDIRDAEACQFACHNVDIVLHQAALGSVPRSIADPLATDAVNVHGFLNMLTAARDNQVSRFVYASSSAVYGDSSESPKQEIKIGAPLSPYAVSKHVNELYAGVFSRTFDLPTVGLRYFNVFGPRQDPSGGYAAVIPRWLSCLLDNIECVIYGDGKTSRDFCYVENVVQANLLAAILPVSPGEVFNIACGKSITLNEVYNEIESLLTDQTDRMDFKMPRYSGFRVGDVRHSLADITKAQTVLGYEPTVSVKQGLEKYIDWWCKNSDYNEAQCEENIHVPNNDRQIQGPDLQALNPAVVSAAA